MHVCVYVFVCVLNIPGPKTYFPKRNKNMNIYIYSCTHTHIHITYMQALLGLHCCTLSLVVASRGYTLEVIHGLLTIVASFVAKHRF